MLKKIIKRLNLRRDIVMKSGNMSNRAQARVLPENTMEILIWILILLIGLVGVGLLLKRLTGT